MFGHLFFLDFQQGRNLCIAFRIGLAGVEGDDVASLGPVEELLLVVGLNVVGHQHGRLDGETALLGVTVLVEFAQVALEHVALGIRLCILVLARARGEHLHLAVHQFVVHVDAVIVDGILVGEFNVELRGNGNVEHERVGAGLLQVLGLLLLRGEGLAEHLHLVVGDVFLYLVANDLVDGIHLDRGAELALNHAHRSLTGTETGHVGFLAIVLQCLFHVVLVVIFFDSDGQQGIDLVGVLK